MAIQPIDLQIMFSQVEKVGKAQNAQREGLALQQEIQGTQLQRKTEEHIKAVNEAQNMGDGAEKVKDRDAQGQDMDEEKKKDARRRDPPEDSSPAVVFSDPCLGRNIDILS